MDCHEIKKLIPAYLDAELEDQQIRQIRGHLEGCPGCQKELKAIEQTWAMLGEVEDIEPQPGFIGRFWTRLALEQSWHEKIAQGVRDIFAPRKLVPVLAGACIVVMVGSFSMSSYFHMQQTNQMLAGLSGNDLMMVENMELVENLDLIQEIDFFEDLDIIENLDTLEV